jgi:putative membrane protein
MKMKRYLTAGTACLFSFAFAASMLAQNGGGAGPSDPQIVGVVTVADQIDIDTAKLALKKTKNDEVRQFAQQMIDDHTALQKAVNDLGRKLNVSPEESDTTRALKTQAAVETKKLRALNGKAFDAEYLNREVLYHQQVIDAAGSVLIPNAKNAELKSALEGAAPLFQGHLEHAQHLQSSLGGASASGGSGNLQ